jgi:hypothetical protein
MFKCATCQNSTGSLFNSTHRDGLQRPRTLGGVEHQSAELLELLLRSGYGALCRPGDPDEISVDLARTPSPFRLLFGVPVCSQQLDSSL